MTARATGARFGLAVVGALLTGGCGDLTSGGLGELEVVVAADSVPASAAGVSGTGARQIGPDTGRLEGTLTLRVQVYVLRPPARWVEVTDGVQEIMIALEGTEPVVLANATLPAGRYRAVRTVFRRVEANVERGLVVDGFPVTGIVRVQLGLGSVLVVDDPIEVEVLQGGESSLLVDLHAARWLGLLDRNLRQVAAQDFQGHFRLRQR